MRNLRIIFSERLTLVFCLGMIVALFFAGCATQDSVRKTGVADIDPSPSMEITAIGLTEDAESTSVVISGTEPLTFMSVKQALPLGVVLYFKNTRLNLSNANVESSGNPVASIHASQKEANGNTSRIEILLASDAPYNVVQTELHLTSSLPNPPVPFRNASTIPRRNRARRLY
jgi:hypothetical protein